MTTLSFSTRVRNTTDEFFREWAKEYTDALETIGLLPTLDTGQATWTDEVRTESRSEAPYKIYRSNDGVTPHLYFKFTFTVVVGLPRTFLEIGLGTDGAGNITDPIFDRQIQGSISGSYQGGESDTGYPSYFCYTRGMLAINWKVGAVWSGAQTHSVGMLAIVTRSCDNAGDPTGVGVTAVGHSHGPEYFGFHHAFGKPAIPVRTTTQSMMLFLAPQNLVSSFAEDGENLAFLCYGAYPRPSPLHSICGVYEEEVPIGNTFQVAMVGSEPRTFIGSGIAGSTGDGATWACGNSGKRLAFLWE